MGHMATGPVASSALQMWALGAITGCNQFSVTMRVRMARSSHSPQKSTEEQTPTPTSCLPSDWRIRGVQSNFHLPRGTDFAPQGFLSQPASMLSGGSHEKK